MCTWAVIVVICMSRLCFRPWSSNKDVELNFYILNNFSEQNWIWTPGNVSVNNEKKNNNNNNGNVFIFIKLHCVTFNITLYLEIFGGHYKMLE